MRTHHKLIFAALTATMLLAIGIGAASARSLRVNERNFEFIWSEAFGAPKTKFEFIARNPGINVQCRVTLLGSFTESTIKKETSITQGNIFHGELESCTNGTAEFIITEPPTPWPIRYRSFSGTLPRIRSATIGILGAAARIREPGGNECEITSEVGMPLVGILGNSAQAAETGLETTGEPENVTAERGNRIRLRGGFLCAFAGEGEAGGIGLVRNLPRTAKIRITLI
ncbi:MAG TPA: hypothetical protein VN635_14935 [Conexibacter sp.]|nr:hypothetical protein [Conexibacter sp.]